jgi:hypothetical protein
MSKQFISSIILYIKGNNKKVSILETFEKKCENYLENLETNSPTIIPKTTAIKYLTPVVVS